MWVGFKWTSDCRNDVFKWTSDCRNGLRIAEMIVLHNFRMFESSAAAEAKHVWICASEWLRLARTFEFSYLRPLPKPNMFGFVLPNGYGLPELYVCWF